MSLRTLPSLYYTIAQLRRYLGCVSLPSLDHDDHDDDDDDAPLPQPTLAKVALLMARHLVTFAFENTSIHYEPHRTVDISPHAVSPYACLNPRQVMNMVVQNSIVPLPGGAAETRQMCERDGLHADLYPYHPTQMAQDVLFRNALTRRPAGQAACAQAPEEVVQLLHERDSVDALKHIFHLLPDVGQEEALASISGTPAELVVAQTA